MPVTIRPETDTDVAAREALLDAALGANRTAKTSERLREGRLPAEGLAFAAEADGHLVGAVRLWNVGFAPGLPGLLLGPLAVAETARGHGVGGALMETALDAAAARGHASVLLVGDPEYYARFGFDAALTDALWLPGAYEARRFQGLELVPGALAPARGLVTATGRPAPRPVEDPVWARLTEALRRAA